MAFGCAKSEARFPGRSGFLAAGQPYSIVFSFFMNTVPVAILIHFVILPLILFIAFLVLFPLKFTGKVWAMMKILCSRTRWLISSISWALS
jgi:hypothetical protein